MTDRIAQELLRAAIDSGHAALAAPALDTGGQVNDVMGPELFVITSMDGGHGDAQGLAGTAVRDATGLVGLVDAIRAAHDRNSAQPGQPIATLGAALRWCAHHAIRVQAMQPTAPPMNWSTLSFPLSQSSHAGLGLGAHKLEQARLVTPDGWRAFVTSRMDGLYQAEVHQPGVGDNILELRSPVCNSMLAAQDWAEELILVRRSQAMPGVLVAMGGMAQRLDNLGEECHELRQQINSLEDKLDEARSTISGLEEKLDDKNDYSL